MARRKRFEDLAGAIGAVIKATRTRAQLTQETVSHDSGVSLRHYQQVESGRMNATLKTLHDIAGVLGVEMHELFADAEQVRKK